MLHVLHDHQKTKIKLLAVLLAALVPFLIFIFYLFDLWYDTQRQLVIEENVTRARILSSWVNSSYRTHASYDLEQLKKQMEEIIGDTGKTVLLIDQEGIIAFRLFHPFEEQNQLQTVASNEHVKKALQGQESIFEFESFPDMPEGSYIGVAQPVGERSPYWVVVSMESTTSIFAPLVSLQNSMWVILGSALIFSFALISYILRKIRIVY